MTEKKKDFEPLEKIPTAWLRALPVPMFALDQKGRIAWCNNAFVEMTGYDRDGLLGARLDALFGQRNINRILDDMLRLYKGQPLANREYDLIRQSGSEMHVEMDLIPVFGEREEDQIISDVFGVVRRFEALE